MSVLADYYWRLSDILRWTFLKRIRGALEEREKNPGGMMMTCLTC